MKKGVCLFLSLCMLFASVPAAGAADAPDVLAVDKTWTILLPEEPTPYEAFAAQKLSDCLAEVFGTAPETVTEPTGRDIAVGAASKTDVSGVADNGYRIQVLDGSIHIGGTGVRGLQAGAYRFLEEFCGRKVYAYNVTVLPQAETVPVPADTDIVYEPFFEYADTDWLSPCDVEYSMANGLTGGTYRRLPEEMGGTVNYLGGFCHTMGGLCETESYAETHPEYLALHDGKRVTDQPCLTEPEVLRIATANVLKLLEEGHDPAASVQIVSVTQNDNYNYCECARCKAFEKAHGGVQSATMLNFVNQIADAVKEAGYDNVAIDTFAYQYTRKAPTGIAPRENVIVRLCTIECCFCHALDDPDCERNVELMQDLSDWSAICDRIYVWDYVNNYSNTCIVFPDFDVIRRNIQVFYENNVRGVYEEGNYYIRNCDTEFGELRAYMISKCLQDPYCDVRSEADGFLDAFYGPAGRTVRKIVDLYMEHAPASFGGHLGIGESPAASFRFTDREVARMDALWEQAKEEAGAGEEEAYLARVERSELAWRFWKGSEGKGEFSVLNPGRFEEKQKLFEDLQSFGVKQISEGSYEDYLDCLCVRYVPVNEWNMYEADEPAARARLFFGRFYEKCMVPILSAFGVYYQIAQAFNLALIKDAE